MTAGDGIIPTHHYVTFFMDRTLRLIENHVTDHDKIVIKGSNNLPLMIGDRFFSMDTDINISTLSDLDTGAVSNGKDYYVYACDNGGNAPVFLLSLNTTYPSGYTANTSTKIGGVHTLCVDVGIIAGHDLNGYIANDILPQSVWDLKHRPVSSPAGMVYDSAIDKWVDIYLASGTGASTISAHGVAISDTRDWMDFVDDGLAVKKRLLFDFEFQSAAAGSNEETNIIGSSDPVITGGYLDTASRRMISNIGTEGACGQMYQWLLDQSSRVDGMSHTHAQTIAHKAAATGATLYKDQAETKPNAILDSGADETITSEATDNTPTWAWYDLPGTKGSLFKQGTYGDVKLLAGGYWLVGTYCGSRSRVAYYSRWYTNAYTGARFLAESM
jgi:hypothetical protein